MKNYHNLHDGANRVIRNYGACQTVQHTRYYPYGEAIDVFAASEVGMHHGASAGRSDLAQPYLYGGKELERMHGLGEYDYGARRLQSHLPLWTTQDPCLEKYYATGPYAHCAANPIRFTDPTGCEWEDQKKYHFFLKTIDKKLDKVHECLAKLSNDLEIAKKKNKKTKGIEQKILEKKEEKAQLEQSKKEVETLEKDENIYVVENSTGDINRVVKKKNGKIAIEASSDDEVIHEIRHISQSFNSGGLDFDEYNQLSNVAKSVEIIIHREVDAYRAQYAYKSSGVMKGPREYFRSIFDINEDFVKTIQYGNVFLYGDPKKKKL